jgi:hypothetical protein
VTGKAKVALGCGIGCLVVGLLAAVGGAIFLGRVAEGPKDVEVTVTAPPRVARDAEFTIEIHVRNTGSQKRVLDSLDLADEYLAGVAIRSSEPPYKDTLHVPIDNSYSYEFRTPIPPGGAVVVRFRALALKPGDHSGDVDVCVDWGGSCTSHPLRTLVE